MSDNIWEDDDDNGQNDNSAGSLRRQLEAALDAKKAAEQETAKYKSQIEQAKASDVLKAKGYDPAISRFAAAEGVNLADEKALDKWLADNETLFPKPDAQQSTDDDKSADEQQDEPPIPAGIEDAYGAISRIHSTATTATRNKYEAALAGVPENATKEQVREALAGL